MHPTARMFTLAVVIVLICSHLILNIITDRPIFRISRQVTNRSVTFAGVEGVNEPVPENEVNTTQVLMTITESDRQQNSTLPDQGGQNVKGPISAAVERAEETDNSNSTEISTSVASNDKDGGGDGLKVAQPKISGEE